MEKENWVEIKEPKTNNNEVKKYIIKDTIGGKYLEEFKFDDYYYHGIAYTLFSGNINDSCIFELTLKDVKKIAKKIDKFEETSKCEVIEVEVSTTSWCNGDKSGSHRTVMPISKGPGIIPTLSAEVEGLRKELDWYKDIMNRAYNLLFEANNHLDTDDDKLRLKIEDWIKDSLDNPFSPDAIAESE